jgi:hypothetical protein
MLEPDHATRSAAAHQGPAVQSGAGLDGNPHALQILSTEHWSLLSARSLGYTEAMSRTSIFVAALSGAIVALALVAQATDFGDEFVAFSLVLLPVVFFLGVTTIVRIGQINHEDAMWVQGMNRIRHAYLELVPALEPYFVTSRFDDDNGVLESIAMPNVVPRYQAFVAIPGTIAVLDAVVAAATVGIAALGLDLGTAASIGVGVVVFGLTLVCFTVWGVRTIMRYRAEMVVRFPSPPAGDARPD